MKDTEAEGQRVLVLPAHFLMDCLLELLVVEDCPDLSIAVAGPVRLEYLRLRLADVRPGGVRVGVEVREV